MALFPHSLWSCHLLADLDSLLESPDSYKSDFFIKKVTSDNKGENQIGPKTSVRAEDSFRPRPSTSGLQKPLIVDMAEKNEEDYDD